MTKVLMGVALAAALAIAPAMAKEKNKNALKGQESQQSDILKQEGQNREPLGDGTFQGKPVVEGPADWHKGGSADAGSASSSGANSSASGASSGEAGSSEIQR